MCRGERWSARTIRERIRGILFERRAILRKPGEVARQRSSQKLRAQTRRMLADPAIPGCLLAWIS